MKMPDLEKLRRLTLDEKTATPISAVLSQNRLNAATDILSEILSGASFFQALKERR